MYALREEEKNVKYPLTVIKVELRGQSSLNVNNLKPQRSRTLSPALTTPLSERAINLIEVRELYLASDVGNFMRVSVSSLRSSYFTII